MRATCASEDIGRGLRPVGGAPYGITQGGRRGREVATVNLHRDHLTIEVVAHELLHATLFWAAHVGLRLWPDGRVHVESEEALAYANGRLMWTTTDRLIRGGLVTGDDLCTDNP
jgi:hypothetical protein